MHTAHSDLMAALSTPARTLPESGIVELVNAGRDKEGLIPLWVGEGYRPTPDFIADGAVKALRDGETFYTWQRGIPQLREALANYHERFYGGTFSPERFFVTGSGMQAIQLSLQAVAEAGDEVIVPTPAWPNFAAAAEILGASVREVPMSFENRAWSLNIDDIRAAITPKTKVIFINSPSNPTGWTATKAELAAILELAREHGLWIIADEVYGRFYFEGTRAPSFYDVMEEGDKIIFNNTFSKNWAMTGWRVGWISAPPELGQVFENLIQFSTSGVATFLQYGATIALNEGDAFVDEQVEMARQARDVICSALQTSERCSFGIPEGAFYLFLKIDGVNDTRQMALDLIEGAAVGLAPGTAFGKAGSNFLRLCFARDPEHIREAGKRLSDWITNSV